MDDMQTVTLRLTSQDQQVARLAAAAIVLAMADAAIPSPLPGVKPGLANIVTLLVLARYGMATAVWISGLRVVAGSLLLGQFLTPGFFLSMAGACGSLLCLSLFSPLRNTAERRFLGLVGLSIFASFGHMSAQILLARAWLVPHDGVFALVPFLATAALIFGLTNGLIAERLFRQPQTDISSKALP